MAIFDLGNASPDDANRPLRRCVTIGNGFYATWCKSINRNIFPKIVSIPDVTGMQHFEFTQHTNAQNRELEDFDLVNLSGL